MSFSNEATPYPTVGDVSGAKEEIALQQFYRTSSSNTGLGIIVSSGVMANLPLNAYNEASYNLGYVVPTDSYFLVKKGGSYIHSISVSAYSDVPEEGLFAIDVVDVKDNSIMPNVIQTKNISANSTDPMILNFSANHIAGDKIRLRFGGGLATTGGAINVNIVSIIWIMKGN